MRTLWLTIILLLCSLTPAPVSAQTQTIDLSTLNLGPVQQPLAVEADGNPATQEWLITKLFTFERRLIRVSAQGALCVGPIFVVDWSWTVQRISGSDAYTQLTWPLFRILWLWAYLPPNC